MKTAHISNQGRRERNEDSWLSMNEDGLFMVCDGVGGAAKGDIASQLCCKVFQEYFSSPGIVVTEVSIQQAIKKTEAAFDHYFQEHPEAAGMATTLTLLSLQGTTAYVAHAGDSRVYHIRNGEIIFVTTDHSLVMEMLASGFISAEEAANHPKKNHITRAIQGTTNPVTADVHRIEGVQPGDYFLLCSDGILESVSEQFIHDNFVNDAPVEELVSKMDSICAGNSSDNYTCIIVQTDETRAIPENQKTPSVMVAQAASGTKTKSSKKAIITVLLLVSSILAAILFVNRGGGKDKRQKVVQADSIIQKEKDTGAFSIRYEEKEKIKPGSAKDTANKKSKPTDTVQKKEDGELVIPSRNPADTHTTRPTKPTNDNIDANVDPNLKKESLPVLTQAELQRIKQINSEIPYKNCEEAKLLYQKIITLKPAQRRIPDVKKFEDLFRQNCK